mgnify:CR=1 FL=1
MILHLSNKKTLPSQGVLCAEDQDRTGDPTIFSRVLYQLSYLGSDAYSTLCGGECQENGF